ncbi:enoyl-CoA hydratase/isomerase family protein [Ktedonosporobacter rubrisoli]|uniref:Enoyl-CoA hydratase/isomerase family protein n=1 Tax=Ktedonosporobacter rubrisoli TaxID=2509675 RepID=A0A4P6JVM7_KTERU|nr:enoyl-CoA hydratase/isomerase family protein [Ktedonosporobacter rubrisoli]QBD79728.1 enoyl-CoA hydratase/isomerase family protein [Ktedonosporobacter rubrisoli]
MPDIHVRLRKDILWLILDKPPLNPLTTTILDQLAAAMLKALKQRPHLIVITGTGELAFCAGVDVHEASETHKAKLLQAATATSNAFKALHEQNIPTVALVKGKAFGAGCELMAFCDTVIAREDATFRLPAVNARVFPDAVSACIPALIGQEQTSQLMQSGETLSAHEALRLGLTHQVLPTNRFHADTEELLVMLSTPS